MTCSTDSTVLIVNNWIETVTKNKSNIVQKLVDSF